MASLTELFSLTARPDEVGAHLGRAEVMGEWEHTCRTDSSSRTAGLEHQKGWFSRQMGNFLLPTTIVVLTAKGVPTIQPGSTTTTYDRVQKLGSRTFLLSLLNMSAPCSAIRPFPEPALHGSNTQLKS